MERFRDEIAGPQHFSVVRSVHGENLSGPRGTLAPYSLVLFLLFHFVRHSV
jgi:hypothetical protein